MVDWKSDIRKATLDNHSKEQRIKEKANILKNEALYKEKWFNIKGDDTKLDNLESFNDLLFESLEAKLSLLNGYKTPQINQEEE